MDSGYDTSKEPAMILKSLFPKGNWWFYPLAAVWFPSMFVFEYLIPSALYSIGRDMAEYYHLPEETINVVLSSCYAGELYQLGTILFTVFLAFLAGSFVVDAYYLVDEYYKGKKESL